MTCRFSVARVVLCALALAVVSPARAADPEIKFEKFKLKNGLTVLLSEDHRLPQVAVDIWYHVGAANQTPGRSGFAHLFEHMMFSGSKHVQPRPFSYLEKIGTVSGSMANGSTSFDRTNYWEIVPANELPTALWIESDRMGYLLDTLDEAKLKVQRDVVSNERRQSYEMRPYAIGFLRLCDLFYPAPHPYYECVIGSIPEIQGASVGDLRDFFRRYYGPNNASLALVGDFDSKAARELVEKYFGSIPAGPPVKPPEVKAAPIASVVHQVLKDNVAELPALTLAWNGVTPFSDDEPACDVLADILGGGQSSRLYKALEFDRQLASSESAGCSALGLGGFFTIDAEAAKGHGVAELQPVIDAQIQALQQEPPSQQEVDRAKRRILAGMVRGLERLSERAERLNAYETFLGDPGFLPRDVARYRAVTPEMVRAVARKLLRPDRRIELDLEPAHSEAKP